MSRKLICVSGLLACFSFHLLLSEAEGIQILKSPDPPRKFLRYLRSLFSQTPLEILASAINRYPHLHPLGRRLFEAYDEFLGALGNRSTRCSLKKLAPGAEGNDPTFQQLRGAGHVFRDALLELLFDERSGLIHLTKTYGAF